MKVVILHYHLNPGGVTRIIESQVNSIQSVNESMPIKVLCGNNRGSAHIPGVSTQVNSMLNYWNANSQDEDFEKNVAAIIAIIQENLSNDTILHCHNPNLGKNPALTVAIYRLALQGYAVINHCHDFPEDRPANLEILGRFLTQSTGLTLPDILYPRLPRYHYITLNSCDLQRILKTGVPASQIHLLHNPVSFHKQGIETEDQELRRKICNALGLDASMKICTYPVRAIERKNLGEFILLAVLFSKEALFTVTQPPLNPLELPRYNRWKSFCLENNIQVKFESGRTVNHEELINISDFCITTSIREGFGMVYLEPWLAGTPVIGRDLPCVTDDLIRHGLEFSRLYPGIFVENEGQMTDFKDLTFENQERIIMEIIRHESSGSRLLQGNPFLLNFLDDFPHDMILRNQRIIKDDFSPEKYGKRLFAIYREISQ